jgi:hypothetical protein
MAGIYSTKLMEAVRSLNDPIKTTSTTTAKSNEGLDIGSLLTMLMLSGMFKQPTTTKFPYSTVANSAESIVNDIRGSGAGSSALATTPATANMNSVLGSLGSSAVPGLQNAGVSELLQLLSKLGPLFQS